MFENVSGKLKVTAYVVTGIGIAACVISFFNLLGDALDMIDYTPGFFLGILLGLILGCLASWVIGLVIYGFSEMIENGNATVRILNDMRSKDREGSSQNGRPVAPQPGSVESSKIPAWKRVEMEKNNTQQ